MYWSLFIGLYLVESRVNSHAELIIICVPRSQDAVNFLHFIRFSAFFLRQLSLVNFFRGKLSGHGLRIIIIFTRCGPEVEHLSIVIVFIMYRCSRILAPYYDKALAQCLSRQMQGLLHHAGASYYQQGTNG